MRRLPGGPALTSLVIAAVACAAVAVTATSRSRRPPSLAGASRAFDTPVLDHLPGGGPDGGAVSSIAAAGARSTVVFAAFDRGGVLKSADQGVSWTPADRGLPAGDSCDLVAVAMSDTLFAACGDGLFMTTSAGALWRQLDVTDAMPPLVAPSDPRVVYQPIVSRSILRSRDGGRRWESRVSEDPGCHSAAAVDPADPFVLYCAGGERLRVSRDGGVSWTSSASAWPAGADITALAVHPLDRNTIVATTTRGRVLQTRTGGASWEEIGSTPEHVDFDRLEFVGDGAVLFASHWTGILRSLDGGRQWQTLLESADLPLLGAAFAVDPRSSSTIYAATRRGVLVTTDGGGRWTLRERGIRRANASVAVHGSAVATLYASNGRDLFASTNDGDSWSVSRVGGDPARLVTSVAADGAGGVLAHTSKGAFQLRSSHSAWTALDSSAVASSAPPRLPGAALFRPGAAGFEYSNDGREWRRASLPGDRTPTSVVTLAGEVVFASTGGPLGQNGIWRSGDAGAS